MASPTIPPETRKTMNNMNDILSKLKEKLSCDSACQKKRTADELKQKWLNAERQAKNSGEEIESAKKNYYLYDEGKNGYNNLKKSSLTPPNYIFPVVWTILYIMIIISGYSYIQNNPEDSYGISIFFIQLFFNIMWSYLFFTIKNPKIAFIDLILLWSTLLLTIIQFSNNKNIFSAYLLVPYFIWVTFAGYLNYYIVINN